jgi:hypothetical protein
VTTQPRRMKPTVMRAARRVVSAGLSGAKWLPEPVEQGFFAVGRRMPPRVRRFARYASRYTRYSDPPVFPQRPPVPDTAVRLFVGPANFAGQGWAWARAAERYLPGVGATAFSHGEGFAFPVDYTVPTQIYALSRRWQKDQFRHLTTAYTHVLIEAERPVFGTRYGSSADGDIKVLRRAGLQVALVSHGSDLRIPSRHAEMYSDSPFHDTSWESVAILERTATHNARLLNSYDGHTFVSTLDLLDYAPRALWCPGVVDPDLWASPGTVPLERPVPVVVHAPSRGRFKGSHLIDPIMADLDRRGTVRYQRVQRVQPHEMPAIYRDADIVIDQFTMGLYGVAACEAMAAGRVVVSFVGDRVRARVRALTGRELPVVEATPATLVAVIEKVLDDRDTARVAAAAGPSYVRDHHDGRRSAAALAAYLTGGSSG